MISFIDVLKAYAKNKVVYVCSNPDEILQLAKENDINLIVMSYDQVKSITEFKYPVALDSYEDFVKYLFPVFDFFDLEVI